MRSLLYNRGDRCRNQQGEDEGHGKNISRQLADHIQVARQEYEITEYPLDCRHCENAFKKMRGCCVWRRVWYPQSL